MPDPDRIRELAREMEDDDSIPPMTSAQTDQLGRLLAAPGDRGAAQHQARRA
ncbi:hypothetical protein [Aeromicrobium sp. Leaf291]|uniref:hypothetical protein n=1 Tax=Aeromicrobium sp. Leaf291 TaxID=1736325 RepID=UPI0012E0CFEF|nr:hypothetical protein [Aeromicrobium sp. Leaf291]